MGRIVKSGYSSIGLFLFFNVVLLFLLLIITGSFATSILALFIALIGYAMVYALSPNQNNRDEGYTVLLITFSIYIVVVILQYLDTIAAFYTFADLDNDHYKFWLISEEGARALSWTKIFRECIIDNVYIENGGYYLYVKTLGYLASHWFDGNSISLQYMGSALPGILSSILIYYLLIHYKIKEAVKYSILYAVLSPLAKVCFGIHRDALIAFLFLILVYIFLARDFNFKTFMLQVIVVLLITSLRYEHGLFASLFILLTAYYSNKKYRRILQVLMLLIVVLYGRTLYLMSLDAYQATTDYYTAFGEQALEELNSGLGRYVYKLPTPIKQIAQIILVNMQFPPWVYLEGAKTAYGFFLGINVLIMNVLWFYYFVYVVSFLAISKLKSIPPQLIASLFLFFLLIVLSTSSLELRRVVCVYPCLFVFFLYIKNYLTTRKFTIRIKQLYFLSYLSISVAYFFLQALFG